MLERVEHSSFTVKDLEVSIPFYRDILGLKVLFDSKAAGIDFRGTWADAITGVPETDLRFVLLTLGETMVELVQYTPTGKPQVDNMANDTGSGHIAFKTQKIHEFYEKLKENNVRTHGAPQFMGLVWVMYFRDPDGNILEVVQGEPPA